MFPDCLCMHFQCVDRGDNCARLLSTFFGVGVTFTATEVELEKMAISGKPVAGVPHFPGGQGARLRQVLLQQQSVQPKLPPAAVMKEAAAWMMGASGNKSRMFFPAHRFIAAHNIRYNPALWPKARYPEEVINEKGRSIKKSEGF